MSLTTCQARSSDKEDEEIQPTLRVEGGTAEKNEDERTLNDPPGATRPITIDNPFLTFDDTHDYSRTERTELEEYVSDFAYRSGLDDRLPLLIFGARLARDKHEAITRYGGAISSREKAPIQKEKETGFWQQSKYDKATIMISSLAGLIQGWTQSINNAANSAMPGDLGLCVKTNMSTCTPSRGDTWVFGMLNSIPLLSAGLFGVMIADPLQERYLGRRGSVMVSTIVTISSTIAASLSQTVGELAGKKPGHLSIRLLSPGSV